MLNNEPRGDIVRKISGERIEKIFFGDAKSQIKNFWGLEDLKELEKRDQITLPLKAQQYVREKLNDCLDDGYEREATLGYGKNGVIVTDEGKSDKSINDYIGSRNYTGVIEMPLRSENMLQFSWNRLFGKPHPIHFHTHPSLKTEDIAGVNIKLPDGSGLTISPQDLTGAVDFAYGTFSGGDFIEYLRSNRYFNSALLASKERVLYLVPSELYLQKGFARFNTLANDYKRRLEAVVNAFMVKKFGLEQRQSELISLSQGKDVVILDEVRNILSTKPSLEDLKMMRDQILVDTASKAGYLVFSTSNINDPILKRLN